MKTAPNKAPLIVLLLCLVVLPLAAQTGKFYSTNNELSSSLINQIFQDKRGFIWIATEYDTGCRNLPLNPDTGAASRFFCTYRL